MSLDVLAPETIGHTQTPATEVLERLAGLEAAHPVLVTLYLRLEVRDRIRRRYHIAARRVMKQVLPRPGDTTLPHVQRETLRRDLARIDRYLDQPGVLPHCPGLAIFACESLGLFEVVPLPRVLHTRLLLDRRPRVAEALAAMEGYGRILVAVADRSHARFFEVTAFGVAELPGLQLPSRRGGRYHPDPEDAPGYGEHSFHDRIREERHRHAAAVAAKLVELAEERPCQGIIMAGPPRGSAEQIPFLPRNLAARVLGTARLNPAAVTAAEVRASALEIRSAWERSHEAGVVAELEEAVGTGWGVNGVVPALRALSRGQVRLLIVAAGFSAPGSLCTGSGRLVPREANCGGEGPAVPLPDLGSAAVDEALQQRLEVEVIDDPQAAARVDGLAALLRFR